MARAETRGGSAPEHFSNLQVGNLLDFLNSVESAQDVLAAFPTLTGENASRIARAILAQRRLEGSLCSLGEIRAIPSIRGEALASMMDAARRAIVSRSIAGRGIFEVLSNSEVGLALLMQREFMPEILACLVNGVRCGTNFFRLAVAKLTYLRTLCREKQTELDDKKRRRDRALAAGGTPTTLEGDIDQLQGEIDAINREVDDLLGKDLHKAWAKLRKNLKDRVARLRKEENDAAAKSPPDKATAEAKSADADVLEKDIEKLDEEEPKQ